MNREEGREEWAEEGREERMEERTEGGTDVEGGGGVAKRVKGKEKIK